MTEYLELVDDAGKEYRVPVGIYERGLDRRAKQYLSEVRTLGALAGFLRTTKQNIELWMEEQPSFKKAVDEGMALGQMKLEDYSSDCIGYGKEQLDYQQNLFEYYMTHVYKVNNQVKALLVPIDPNDSASALNVMKELNK